MPRLISGSIAAKAVVLVAAVVTFLLLYETRMLDSRWLALAGDAGPPRAGQRLPFEATAYCKGTTTASGVPVRNGIAAADPELLPVGSVVDVATGDPEHDGVYTVLDTGPRIQGRMLDLYMWSCHDALDFGRRRVEVSVLRLGWDPQASAPRLIDRLFRRREAERAAEPLAEPPVREPDVPDATPAALPDAEPSAPEAAPVSAESASGADP